MNECYYRYALVVLTIIAIAMRYDYDRRHRTNYVKPRAATDMRRDWLHGVLTLLFGGLVMSQLVGYDVLTMSLSGLTDTVVRSCGLILTALAVFGTLWPRYIRKNTWSDPITSPDRIGGHRLITWGPYRYVRHPYYASCILGVFAGEFTLASYLAFVLPPIVILITVIGVSKEERQLEAVYGDQFRAYKAQSWRLIPLVY